MAVSGIDIYGFNTFWENKSGIENSMTKNFQKNLEMQLAAKKDEYLKYTDNIKENSWSRVLESKYMYDRAYVKLQSDELQGSKDKELCNNSFEDMKSEDSQSNKARTVSDIVVKADGSRVLVITMKIGGMESTMSIKISDPTEFVGNEKTEPTESENIENMKQ